MKLEPLGAVASKVQWEERTKETLKVGVPAVRAMKSCGPVDVKTEGSVPE